MQFGLSSTDQFLHSICIHHPSKDFSTHHFFSVVSRHMDLFAILPNRITGGFLTPARLLRLQPLLVKLIHVCNWIRGQNKWDKCWSVTYLFKRDHQTLTELTVVFLHVGPKVSFFNTVGKCAIPSVLALLASCHMHANLRRENYYWGFLFQKLRTSGVRKNTNKPRTEMGCFFWLEVVWLSSTFSFHGSLRAPPACLLPTWDREKVSEQWCILTAVLHVSNWLLFMCWRHETRTCVLLLQSNTSCFCLPRWVGRFSSTGHRQTSSSDLEAQTYFVN